MSYCMFHNTLLDLRECFSALENQEKLSPEEEKDKNTLIKMCERIACDFGDLSPERR